METVVKEVEVKRPPSSTGIPNRELVIDEVTREKIK
jgi:hypothetical protein